MRTFHLIKQRTNKK